MLLDQLKPGDFIMAFGSVAASINIPTRQKMNGIIS
jgi:hypothetical protein